MQIKHFLYVRFDWRLTFANLKTNSKHGNTVGDEERKKNWIPSLVFENSVKDTLIKNDEFSSLKIIRKGSFGKNHNI